MLTKNDVHTFIIDDDTWKLGMSFQKVTLHHENCDSNSITKFYEEIPHRFAGIYCSCHKTAFKLPDWSLLLTFIENRPTIYYQNGKILRLFNKNFVKTETPSISVPSCTIEVQQKKNCSETHFDHIGILHRCEPVPCNISNWGEFTETSICGTFGQEFDFNNFDLLVAIFNARIHNLTSFVKTNAGEIKVLPVEDKN
jgi:hypothetical protein